MIGNAIVQPLRRVPALCVVLAAFLYLTAVNAAASQDALPSWREGPSKQAIRQFVEQVTDPNSPMYVRPEERIAVFDNDGTLWSEQPTYVQFAFAIDRVKALAPYRPEWKAQQPFKALLENDLKTFTASSMEALSRFLLATHTGMTTREFAAMVSEWMHKARHPRFKLPYTDLVFQPMLELLAYLRDHGFINYIVSAGGLTFMRPWTQRVYGIPPEQVVGSRVKMQFVMRNGKPVLVRLPEYTFINDSASKPVGIQQSIGRRPLAAFGNSDGDLQMLQWTAAGPGARLMMLIHHTDAEREWAYDRQSPVGRLDKALDEARARGWTVVDMKRDWKSIYPFQK